MPSRFTLFFFSFNSYLIMKSLSIIASITLAFISSAIAQEGATVPTANTGSSSTYSCDPNTCKIANNCLCASQSPPGGLSPKDTPQVKHIFIQLS